LKMETELGLVIQMNTFGKPKMNDRICFSLYDRHISY